MAKRPPEFTCTSSQSLHRGRIYDVIAETWKRAGGHPFRREIITHPGAVAVLPYLSATKILLLRQWRAGARDWLLEVPAGTLEKGEAPLVCAKRELVEETGHSAKKWHRLGGIFTAPGFCTEYIHLFSARELVAAESNHDDDEHIEVVPMSWTEIKTAVKADRIQDAKSLSAICHALLTRS